MSYIKSYNIYYYCTNPHSLVASSYFDIMDTKHYLVNEKKLSLNKQDRK